MESPVSLRIDASIYTFLGILSLVIHIISLAMYSNDVSNLPPLVLGIGAIVLFFMFECRRKKLLVDADRAEAIENLDKHLS